MIVRARTGGTIPKPSVGANELIVSAKIPGVIVTLAPLSIVGANNEIVNDAVVGITVT